MSIFILFRFFFLGLLWIPINADDVPILGISSCVYSGSYDESGAYGIVLPMPVSSLALQCTSFIYDGIIYNGSNANGSIANSSIAISSIANSLIAYSSIADSSIANGSIAVQPFASINNINALIASGKKVFLIYTHGSLTQWSTSLNNNSINTEKEQLSLFLQNNSVSGIILKDLDYNYDDHLPFTIDTTFYTHLKDYILSMKQSSTDLKIGLYVNASNIISYSIDTSTQDFFNFTILNDAVDFYIIEFDGFNPCNDKFRGGIVPLCGPKSLVSFTSAFNSTMIPSNKTYIQFSVNPNPDAAENNLPINGITYQKLCEDSKYQKLWCADNSDSLYYKGRFAKETINAQGIVVKYIDAIDPAGSCNCDSKNQFITFQMMLRGFTQADPIKDCSPINNLTAVNCGKDGNP
ncbi:uncharacterized protein LOC113556140 [Rhopalosiphum maidis]|uniref:uncharacterized protein LOC113556140 n=1 Tax=Rhopalosiphum maidis TaxID=43146 RepID=UPI000EFDC01F|nr:uncharacterized protein LOC113556140 [Rhopalosiphum maidis]